MKSFEGNHWQAVELQTRDLISHNDNDVFNIMMMIAFGEMTTMMTIVFDKMMRS